MKPYQIHPAAALEAEDSILYYNRQRRNLGYQFRAELKRSLFAISNFPEAAPVHKYNIHRYSMKKFPYGILYLNEEELIYILAIMHQSRKPGYWDYRLEER